MHSITLNNPTSLHTQLLNCKLHLSLEDKTRKQSHTEWLQTILICTVQGRQSKFDLDIVTTVQSKLPFAYIDSSFIKHLFQTAV